MFQKQGMPARRAFVLKAVGVAAGAAAVAFATPARAVDLPATTTGKCGTCDFWGGKRQVSADRATVMAEGRGQCNNPASPAHGKQTEPTQGVAQAWKRWAALDAKT